ncbi:MAG: N-acetylmuramoyl-L-alanine amidase, partial [Xanthobacteraceae bacterium]
MPTARPSLACARDLAWTAWARRAPVPHPALIVSLLAALSPQPARSQDPVACEPANFRIVLDVGHTAEAGGARSARGVPEYVFNLRLARQIERGLDEAGFARAGLLIMTGVGRWQLLRRSARANASAADLFVSIHHDSVQDSYLARWEHDGRTDRFSDRFSGHSLFVADGNARFDDSLAFARLLADELMARGMHFTLHHAEDIPGERRPLLDPDRGIYRYDELLVLKNTAAPAVLLEAGVIVNRAEELALAAPERQRTIAAAMVAAVG